MNVHQLWWHSWKKPYSKHAIYVWDWGQDTWWNLDRELLYPQFICHKSPFHISPNCYKFSDTNNSHYTRFQFPNNFCLEVYLGYTNSRFLCLYRVNYALYLGSLDPLSKYYLFTHYLGCARKGGGCCCIFSLYVPKLKVITWVTIHFSTNLIYVHLSSSVKRDHFVLLQPSIYSSEPRSMYTWIILTFYSLPMADSIQPLNIWKILLTFI